MRWKKRIYWIRFIIATFSVVLIAVPIYFMIIGGMMELAEIHRRPPYLIPPNPTLQYYRESASLMKVPLKNSLIIAACVSAMTLLWAPLVGFGLGKLRLGRGAKGVTLGLIFLLQLLPAVAVVTPLFLVFHKLGLVNTTWSVIIAISAGQIPFASLILATYMMSGVPTELLESAYLDGASGLRIFTSIVLPLSRPALGTVALLAFMAGWGELLLSMSFIQKKALYPASVAMTAFTTVYGTQWNLLMAAATLYALPPIVVAVVAGKQLASGLIAGALK